MKHILLALLFLGVPAAAQEITVSPPSLPLSIANGGTGAATTSQNFGFFGPTSGSGAPAFRALVAGDIPSLSATYCPLVGCTYAGTIQAASWSLTTAGALAVTSLSGTPNFSGTPTFANPVALGSSTATTQSPGDNSTKIATTAFDTAAFGAYTPYANVTLLTAASGTFTPPSTGPNWLDVIECGAGGGGGGVGLGAAATAPSGVPGIVIHFRLKVTPGSGITYSMSTTGGSGGANTGGTGGTGGDTTFGSVIAKGGTGGAGSTTGNTVAISNAAFIALITQSVFTVTTSYIPLSVIGAPNAAGASNLGGQSPGFQSYQLGVAGTGGVSSAGGNASGYCSPGGGAADNATGQFIGGTGAPGLIIVSY